ncbi:MAG TPA: acyltransferase [Nitrospiraceae bacterium]|nr:acyltransferase [Nitrospiraceae bacterium]
MDTLRVLAMLTVVAIHTNFELPTESFTTAHRAIVWVLQQCYSWAVPFFFIVSGYFFTRGWHPGSKTVRRYVIRLVSLLLVWHIIDACAPHNPLADIEEYGFIRTLYWQGRTSWNQFIDHPLAYLFRPHLWFILSLIIALCIQNVFLHLRLTWISIPITVVLIAIYAQSPSEVSDRILLGLLCVGIGSLCALRSLSISFFAALATVCIAAVVEILLVTAGLSLWGFPYYTCAIVFALGMFFLGLAWPNLGKDTILPRIGRLTLGVYLCHMPLIKILSAPLSFYLGQPFFVGIVVLPIVVFGGCVILVWTFTVLLGTSREKLPIARTVSVN